MLVKFTNRAPGREDDPLYINPDHVTAAYVDKTEQGELVTVIYGGVSDTTWIVQESLTEVEAKLNA